VTAPGAGPTAEYVGAATLAGRPLDRTWLSTGELMSGRTLSLTMSATPTTWASGPDAAPPSLSDR
jgi:putative alpha-1,2-mannosidase